MIPLMKGNSLPLAIHLSTLLIASLRQHKNTNASAPWDNHDPSCMFVACSCQAVTSPLYLCHNQSHRYDLQCSVRTPFSNVKRITLIILPLKTYPTTTHTLQRNTAPLSSLPPAIRLLLLLKNKSTICLLPIA